MFDPFKNISSKLFNPHRIMLIYYLHIMEDPKWANLRKKMPYLTDGNLNSHLRALRKEKLVVTKKYIEDEKFCTRYYVTKEGIDQYKNMLDQCNSLYNILFDVIATVRDTQQ